MGILHDIVSVLQDDLYIMKRNEKMGYKDLRMESVEKFIEDVKQNDKFKEEER